MRVLERLVDLVFKAFCRHEWVNDHRAGRMWLRCLHCGKTTEGLEVGGMPTRRNRKGWRLFRHSRALEGGTRRGN